MVRSEDEACIYESQMFRVVFAGGGGGYNCTEKENLVHALLTSNAVLTSSKHDAGIAGRHDSRVLPNTKSSLSNTKHRIRTFIQVYSKRESKTRIIAVGSYLCHLLAMTQWSTGSSTPLHHNISYVIIDTRLREVSSGCILCFQ